MSLVFNKARKSKLEAKKYYHTSILYNNENVDILLTESDVQRGIHRANKNQEDIPRRWYDLFIFWK